MKVAECFPDQAVHSRVKNNLKIMADYEWELLKERNKALEHVKAMINALELGYCQQAQLHFFQAEDKMLFDYSNKAIRIAKNEGLKMKPLAKLDETPGQSFRIRSSRNNWEFKPIESYDKIVPADILKKANLIQKLGLRWQMCFIGEPHVSSMRQIKDPILAISIGRWILEVDRWE